MIDVEALTWYGTTGLVIIAGFCIAKAYSGPPRPTEPDSGLAILDDETWTAMDQDQSALDDIAAIDRGDDSLTADLNNRDAWSADFDEWTGEFSPLVRLAAVLLPHVPFRARRNRQAQLLRRDRVAGS